jgi:hypothetical protein
VLFPGSENVNILSSAPDPLCPPTNTASAFAAAATARPVRRQARADEVKEDKKRRQKNGGGKMSGSYIFTPIFLPFPEPWFASPGAAIRNYLLLSSPAPFRSRNLFIDEDSLIVV